MYTVYCSAVYNYDYDGGCEYNYCKPQPLEDIEDTCITILKVTMMYNVQVYSPL